MANPLAVLADRRLRSSGRFRASFSGAGTGRLMSDWTTSSLHPDREILYNQAALIARARELQRNDSNIAGFYRDAVNNVIGPLGMRLQAKVKTRDGTLRNDVNREIETRFADWGRRGNCTVEGSMTFRQVQRLVYGMRKRDNDVFVRFVYGTQFKYGVALEIYTSEMLDPLFDRAPDADGVEIRAGIQYRHGRKEAYHFYKRHPGDRWGSRERLAIAIPASEVLHLRTVLTAGQTRGYPEIAPALFDSNMMRSVVETELVGWVASSSKAGVAVARSPEAIERYSESIPTDPSKPGSGVAPAQAEYAPGMIEFLPPGWEYQAIDPTHPNSSIDSAGKFFQHRQAKGLGAAYSTFSGDHSQDTYSSMKQGLGIERDHWAADQQDFIDDFLFPVYEVWIGCALLTPHLRVDSRLKSEYLDVLWKPRGWRSPELLKDRMATALGVQLAIESRQDAAAAEGRDYEEIIEELAHEQKVAEAAGVWIYGDTDVAVRAQGLIEAEDREEATSRAAARARLQAV